MTYSAQFTDVRADDWFSGSVEACYTLGLMKGRTSSTFVPNGDVTLAEVVTIAARVHKIYQTGNSELPLSGTHWYDGAVDYLLE